MIRALVRGYDANLTDMGYFLCIMAKKVARWVFHAERKRSDFDISSQTTGAVQENGFHIKAQEILNAFVFNDDGQRIVIVNFVRHVTHK